MSSTYEAYTESLARRKMAEEGSEERRVSFAALGLDVRFVKGLHSAFPNVQEPTAVQAKLIPEILAGKDILLKDATGTGK
jgi:superfamily II DNA/RNA helicase